jgi:pimeloyl-ACP methyl ester carboxylesterase
LTEDAVVGSSEGNKETCSEDAATIVQNEEVSHLVLQGTAFSDLPPRDSELYSRLSTCPTLILTIEGDPAHPVETATALGTLLPHSTLHIAPSIEDAVAAWPSLITNFVASLHS